ncbi:MAG: hypothetical protein QNJ57_08470 [Flavobacteriaceae bacterium]|nr:hypothetical protein [Flavobacteriaceae bacterium]
MTNSKLSRILTIVAAVIGLLGAFFLVRIMMAGSDEVQNSADLQNSIVSPFIAFTQVVLFIAAAAAILFSVWNLIKHPQALKKTLMMLVVLGVILLIAYFTASDAAVTDITGNIIKNGEAGSTSKWVSALINFTGFLGLGGIILIGLGVVRGMLK